MKDEGKTREELIREIHELRRKARESLTPRGRARVASCTTGSRVNKERDLREAREELESRVLERTTELQAANEQLRLVPSRLLATQEEERKRLAVELHDSVGQTLAALKFGLENILYFLEGGDSLKALELVHQFVPILQRSIEETRAIYMGLRPRMLEEIGVLPTLRWFCREVQTLYPNQHIELETEIEENEIPHPLKIAIFRITQEALNNAAKYGRAEWVDVSLSKRDESIELVVADEGVGMDLDFILNSATARTLGLAGMKERAELTGGRLLIESKPGEGTTIKAVWKMAQLMAICPVAEMMWKK